MVFLKLLKKSCKYLYQLAVTDLQGQWLPQAAEANPLPTGGIPYPRNAKGYLTWPKGGHSLWLGQHITVPTTVQGYDVTGLTLRLALTWWAERATVYVNGQAVHHGDLFDHSVRLCLEEAVIPGQGWDVVLELVSPQHDEGALVQSQLLWESPTGVDPAFLAAELEILQIFLDHTEADSLAPLLARVLETKGNRACLDPLLNQLHDGLQRCSEPLRQFRMHLCGHAHLDLAWLWPIAETWTVAEATFASVLALKKRYPELTFTHSTPALYAHLEHHAPDLFAAIQAAVAAGWWDIAAGLWVEPELNLISGESIVRQLLYGQHYVQRAFGKVSPIAWLPDTFGFPARLPSFLSQAGIRYFVTQKLRWNDTTHFPYGWFQWQDAAGATIPSLMSAPIGTGIDPVKMATYSQEWFSQTGSRRSLWLPGVGDHGGGPTADMLEIVRRWQRLEGIGPQWQWTTVRSYLDQLMAETPPQAIWQDELYLEFHRGCYTSHGDQKAAHDCAQRQLQQAELWSTLAAIATAAPYPQATLTHLWQQLLFNQFHDILPGSSSPEVYAEVNPTWQVLIDHTQNLISEAQAALLRAIDYGSPPVAGAIPVVIFNGTAGNRAGVIHLDLAALPAAVPAWYVYCPDGDYDLPTQVNPPQQRLSFWAQDIPAVGYRLLWLCPRWQPNGLPTPPLGYVLENNYLHVEIDPSSGEIINLYDKLNHCPCLGGRGNQLQFFCDQGQYWDAWNIDPTYPQHQLMGATLESIQWVTWHQLEQRLRVTWRFQSSRIQQDYVLEYQTPWLRIDTHLDWQEEHVLLKAAFPLAISAPTITCETPGGITERPTLPNPDLEPHCQAKWEVPFLTWVDLSTPEYGLSLFSDCKHGVDAQPQQLRLTLLRSPTWPDPNSDRGEHHFSYGLFPHRQSWQAARVPDQSLAFNMPLTAVIAEPAACGPFPPHGSLLAWSDHRLHLMALKQAEDGRDWILRVRDAYGNGGTLALEPSLLPWRVSEAQNLLETAPLPLPTPDGVKPWQILTLRLQIASVG